MFLPSRLHLLLGFALSTLLFGCRHEPVKSPAAAAPTVERERVGVIVTTREALTVSELLVRAERRLLAGEYERAEDDFELLLAARHEPALEVRIRLGYARALEGTGRLELAADQLEIRLALVSDEERERARVEWVARLLMLEHVVEAEAAFAEARSERLTSEGRVLLAVSRALSAVRAGDTDRADRALVPAWGVLDDAGEPRPSSLALPAAWLSFAEGEVASANAARITFDPVPDDVVAVLEERCEYLVAAQSAYAEAMRLESGRLRLLSGLRIAGLYTDLYRDILQAPLPPDVASHEERRALSEGALRLRYGVLLHKAEQMLRITLSGTPDTAAAREVRARLAASLNEVQERRASIAKELEGLPVTQSDLVGVLESIGAPPLGDELPPAGESSAPAVR